MERLLQLAPIVSDEANKQAGEIMRLIDEATAKRQSYIEYETYAIHPLVQHTLVSKGYKVVESTFNITATLQRTKKYYITL
jgi:hypothetical protein